MRISAFRFPCSRGRIARRDCEYQRCGTANTFCGVEPKASHFTRATPDRSSAQFADHLLEIAESYPGADTIHLVMDNLISHTRKAMVERFGEKAGGWLWDRFAVHYTPKHGSWAEPGGNRDQPVPPLVPRPAKNSLPGRPATGNEDVDRKMNRNRITIDWKFTRKQARLTFRYKRNQIMRSET